MLVISALWLSWFLYRPLKTSAFNLEKSNIALGRQKQTELEQDSSTRCFILAILCAKVGTFSLWTLTSVTVVYEVSDW
jgi:hypothetical protein